MGYSGPSFESMNLYDIQFENDGSYIANGVQLQSRCPRSQMTPLAKEDYFNQELYTEEVVWDVFNHSVKYDDTILIQ